MVKPFNYLAATILISTGFCISYANVQAGAQQNIIRKIEKQNPALDRAALLAGVTAYHRLYQQGDDQQQILTIVNFHLPSYKKRLWTFNMADGDLKYFTYVAHGDKSGLVYATHFSNKFNTHESSIGVYLTGHTYDGVDGYSLRLHGLDKGFNSNAFQRDIVMHPAWYVSTKYAKKYGMVGRTYGCFGVSKRMAPKIISTIKNGTVMVAYYPNKKWLDSSLYERAL